MGYASSILKIRVKSMRFILIKCMELLSDTMTFWIHVHKLPQKYKFITFKGKQKKWK